MNDIVSRALSSWKPPPGWQRIGSIDMHTGGEPLRVLYSGLPPIEGRDVLEKRRFFRDHYDYIRTGTMWEPRGHADMYGAILTPSEEADFDVFFLHNEGYSTMCGHAVIALTKLVFETGMKQAGSEVTFRVPAGVVRARATIIDGRVVESTFRSVPCFSVATDSRVDVAGLGWLAVDVAYGGAFYAIVPAAACGVTSLEPRDSGKLIDLGRRIKAAVPSAVAIRHPFEPDLSFLYGTIFTGAPGDPRHHSRNVCIFADGELDRSATGSGVSARAAALHARGELASGVSITIESILGTTMSVRIVGQQREGPHEAVILEVSGSAAFTGRSEFWFDPADPQRAGFLVR